MISMNEAVASLQTEAKDIVPFFDNFVTIGDCTAAHARFPWTDDQKIPVTNYCESIYGDPAISVNIPIAGNVEINLVPTEENEVDNLTSSISPEEDTVKSDPYDLSTFNTPGSPEDSLADEKIEDDTPRFITLQDIQ